MSTRLLIILVVIIVILAVLALVLGGLREERKPGDKPPRKPAYTAYLGRAFGSLVPGFDLEHLRVDGKQVTQRQLVLKADQQVTLTVSADPDAGINDCRSLTLALLLPELDKAVPEVVHLDLCTLKPPLPESEDFEEPDDDSQLLPNPEPGEDPITGRIDPERFRSCSIPVFRGGATIRLTAKRACTLEIR